MILEHLLGIKVLASAISTTASSECAVLSLIVIGMHLRFGTDSGKRMFRVHPLYASVALRPLDFHGDF